MIITRARFLLASCALTAATLAACGGGGQTTAPMTAPPSASGNQINAMSRDKVKDGGTLTFPIDQIPVNYNYNQIDGTILANHDIIMGLMPIIFLGDAGGTAHWNPSYLASDPILTANPKQVVTYEINPRAMWDDGTPITWQDFYWLWKANNGTNKAYQIASSNGYEEMEKVERGKDDREAVVTFLHPYADWRAAFSPLYPASTNKNPKIFNEGWRDRPLVTAGPFRFDLVDQTAKTLTVVRNDKWWGAPAKLDRIIYRSIEMDAQIDALANGEVDFIDIGPDANKYNRAKTIANAEIRVAGGPNFRHITLNGTAPNLTDVKVRQAIAMAIDRAAIARALLGPLGVSAQPLNNHIFMANQAGYQDNSGDVGKYNPEKAKALLEEAGWRMEGATRKRNGKPLEVVCVIPGAVATSRQESELMQNMLAQVGVSLKISVVPGSDFFDKYVRPGQFDMTVFSWMGTAFPISSAKSIYATPRQDAKGELDIQQNYARIGTSEIDDLYRQATQELDPARAIELANRIDAALWQEVHSLTQYQRPELYAVRKGLANYGALGFADAVYADIGWAK